MRADSALLFIDSISYPEQSLNRRQYMEYLITRTQIYYKNYLDISDDTTVFKARDYFDSKKNREFELAFLGYFYSGCVYREQKRDHLAIAEYKRALELAQYHNDDEKQALVFYNMGGLYFDKRAFRQALDYYQQSVEKYVNNPAKELVSLHRVAQSSLLSGNADSSLVYMQRGKELARSRGNKRMEAKFINDMAIVLFEEEEYPEAITLLHQSHKINPDTVEISQFYLNLAQIYHGSGQNDSAVLYAIKLQEVMPQCTDVYFHASANSFLADFYTETGDYPSAIRYLHSKDSCILQIMKDTNVAALEEAARKYDWATKETQLAKEKTRSYRFGMITAITLLMMLVMAGIGVYFLNKHRRQKEKNRFLQQEAEHRLRLNEIYRKSLVNIVSLKNRLSNLISNYDIKKTEKLKREVLEEIKKEINGMEIVSTSEYAPFVAEFLSSLEILDDTQIDLLKPDEHLLLILLHARYSHAEIATLLQINNHALTSRKSRLKEKMCKAGFPDMLIFQFFSKP